MGENQTYQIVLSDGSLADGSSDPTDWVIQRFGICTLRRWFELLVEIKPTKLMRYELVKSLEEQGLL